MEKSNERCLPYSALGDDYRRLIPGKINENSGSYMFDLKNYLANRKNRIDRALHHIIAAFVPSGRLGDAMHYSLTAGGKRIRPILCLAAADALEKDRRFEDLLNPACSLELIHTYSLIHDDLPAMDNDDLRRGKPTCHVKFDDATAILAGDALLTLAFEVLSDPGLSGVVTPGRQVQLIRLIASAAGAGGMVQGQMLDIGNEGKRLCRSELEHMHRLKTGALIEASVAAGAILAGGDEDRISALKAYGRQIGLAFQVTDDILNIEGDPNRMGKSVGTDAAVEKCTYPVILGGVDAARRFARDLIDNALNTIDDFGTRALPLREIATYIINRDR
ncbi:MAG: polyprenyl synthetase family protein [Desulfobacterales bacterium]